MHMSDALVSTAVGTTMAVVSAGSVGYSIKKIQAADLSDGRIPMMGVMGAFVFAAQMINFTIPGTGSSGHIGGGILLAALLGPYPAFLTITSVLIIQALFFADGGLLALGCNIFNMGFLTCFVAYPLIYRLVLKKSITPKRISFAALFAVIAGLQLGAFAVVMETTVSGITELPFTAFVLPMQLIHLAIGLVEGIITGAVLCFVYRTRREIIKDALDKAAPRKSPVKRVILLSFVAGAVLIGGFFSYFASAKPDGLEWAIQGIAGEEGLANTSAAHTGAQKLQSKTAVLPDYAFEGKAKDNKLGTGVSGLVGGLVTLSVTIAAGVIVVSCKRLKPKKLS